MNSALLMDAPASFDEGRIDSGDGHLTWYAQYGNPQGIPLFWLHGGPGSASSLRHIGLVDLARYRLVLSDQRGCGRSLPLGALQNNETRLLIEDIEKLRTRLQLDRIVVGGGSWGATLALLYAAQYRAQVAALLLRAPFLASKAAIAAFFAPPAQGPHDSWQAFAALAPPSQRQPQRLLPWLARQLATAGHEQCVRIACAWNLHEQRQEFGNVPVTPPVVDAAMIARYRIQAHYLLNACFLGIDEVLSAARMLDGLPVAILHGDADRVCPPHNARLLQRCVPQGRLLMVGGAGHAPFHPGMAAALAQALYCYARNAHFEGWGSGDD